MKQIFFVLFICKCLGDRDTINYQMPTTLGLIVYQMARVCWGGGGGRGFLQLELTRALLYYCSYQSLYKNGIEQCVMNININCRLQRPNSQT